MFIVLTIQKLPEKENRVHPNCHASLAIKANMLNYMSRWAEAAAKELVRIHPEFSPDVIAKTQPYKDPQALESLLSMLKSAGLR